MKRLTIVTLVVLFSMVLAACGGAATPAPAPTAAPAAAAPTAAPAPTTAPEPTMVPEATQAPAAAPAAAGVGASAEGAASKGLTCLADAYNGKMKGTKVTLDGPFSSDDIVKFDSDVRDFEAATGIDIQYVGTKEFEASIGTAMAAGTASDVIDFPQPGLAARFFEQGKIIPATEFVPTWDSARRQGRPLKEDARSRREARERDQGGPAGTRARCLSRRRVTRPRAPGSTPCRRLRRTTEGRPPLPCAPVPGRCVPRR